MTEKEETVELSAEPMEWKTKKPHRGRAVAIIAVAVIALLAAGGIVWKTHTDRLMAEARADCAAASERLHVANDRVRRAIEWQGRQYGEDRREKREGREDP